MSTRPARSTDTLQDPLVLVGSRCATCGNVAFPTAVRCHRCSAGDCEPLPLATSGVVWAATVQRFAPKSPPYVPPAEGFTPFAVGYVELPDGVRVEAVIDCGPDPDPHALAGTEVELVATLPVPRFATVPTTPTEESAR
ncbi:Zn-ribbon domain-containing OB-fold protein [Nocardioides yefusunii]|uniref:Zn-ribbon domain-containing OB-fold protein n=1 Tax=Nocardioides yefusunii TaxID=2500546 RepID=A0ABW1QWS6_9ACTN|nr:OB-fold domain-containing protein [Nocardioides yefusunii]